MNKHTALKNFVQKFLGEKFLNFDFIDFVPGARSLVPNYGDYQVKQDIQGNKYKQYTFAFIGIERFETGTNNQNELNYQLFDDFNEWILEQEKNKQYPDFGKNITGYEWEPLQNMANLAQADIEKGEAKYMLMCKLNYIEKGE